MNAAQLTVDSSERLAGSSASAAEARELTDRIKGAADQLWSLLLEAHEKRVWIVLGYGSFREYAKAEFSIGQSQIYRLLDQGRVIRALEQVAGSPFGESITEKVARDIKPHLDAVVVDAKERVAGGDEPRVAVEAAIAAIRVKGIERVDVDHLLSRKRAYSANGSIGNIALYCRAMVEAADAFEDVGLDEACVDQWVADLRGYAKSLERLADRIERGRQP